MSGPRQPQPLATVPRATAALDPVSGRSGSGPPASTDEPTLLRLALWLADVAAEATLAATRPEAGTPGGPAPPPAGATEPPARSQ